MKIIITSTFCFLAIGWSIYLWNIVQPKRSVEQVRNDTYYDCVRTAYNRGQDIDNCNKIK